MVMRLTYNVICLECTDILCITITSSVIDSDHSHGQGMVICHLGLESYNVGAVLMADSMTCISEPINFIYCGSLTVMKVCKQI